MRSMQWQLGISGTISAFAYRHRETKKSLCRGGRSQDLPNTDLQPAARHSSVSVVPINARPEHRAPILTTSTLRYPVSHPLDINGSFLGVKWRRSVTPAILRLDPNLITRGVKPPFETYAWRRSYLQRLCYLTFTADNHGLKKKKNECWNAAVAGNTREKPSLEREPNKIRKVRFSCQ